MRVIEGVIRRRRLISAAKSRTFKDLVDPDRTRFQSAGSRVSFFAATESIRMWIISTSYQLSSATFAMREETRLRPATN
jgi:hypothetical protein